MTTVFKSYTQSIPAEVRYILDTLSIRGFTHWPETKGQGSAGGEMHEGSHTWPELNTANLTMAKDVQTPLLPEKPPMPNKEAEKQGLRAFVWNMENTV